jgi:hypothetical protein
VLRITPVAQSSSVEVSDGISEHRLAHLRRVSGLLGIPEVMGRHVVDYEHAAAIEVVDREIRTLPLAALRVGEEKLEPANEGSTRAASSTMNLT